MASSIDKNTNEIITVGRRKRASARVRIKPGSGLVTVNGKPIREYLGRDVLVDHALEAFEAAGLQDTFDLRVLCEGGGMTGQAGAIRLGLARALVAHDENLLATMRSRGLMTRDAREVERKKYGQPGARKRFQFSKR